MTQCPTCQKDLNPSRVSYGHGLMWCSPRCRDANAECNRCVGCGRPRGQHDWNLPLRRWICDCCIAGLHKFGRTSGRGQKQDKQE
jgi:hypothetical protein